VSFLAPPETPLAGPATGAPRRGLALSLLGLGLASLVLLAISAVAGLEIATRGRIAPGVTALGVPLGGLTPDAATARLAPTVATVLDRPLDLRLGGRVWTASARDLGLRLEAAELADEAYHVGRDGSPVERVTDQAAALVDGSEVTVRRTAEGSALDGTLARVGTAVDRPAQDARLTLGDDGAVDFAPSTVGQQLDRAASREAVLRALTDGAATVDLVARDVPPSIATELVEPAHAQLTRLLRDGASVRLTAGQHAFPLARADILGLLSLEAATGPGHPAVVQTRPEALQALVQRLADGIDQEPQNARFDWAGGALTPLRPSRDGRALDQETATSLLSAGILAGQPALELPVVVVHPAVSAAAAADTLRSAQVIASSSTSFVGSIPEKRHNIRLAAERLNGVVVPPGGTFSFNREVGPTTLEAGFQWGFGLTDAGGGVHTVPSVAGGICQVATTLFQPVFWAGYQLEERYWHLYWIPAYASQGFVGLDATVDSDAGLDLRWTNPTPDPVLIQASADDEKVSFSLYGRKPSWSVQVEEPVISHGVTADPTPVVQEEPSLPWGRTLPVEAARDGFEVVVTRHVVPSGGGRSRDLALKSVYQPSHTVTLVGTGGRPAGASVGEALDRVRASQQPAAPSASLSAPAPAPAPAAAAAPPVPTAHTYETPNGPRTLAQIRDELQRAGWGGGADQDALATYNRVAAAAKEGSSGR